MKGILITTLLAVSVPAFAQQDPGVPAKDVPKAHETFQKNELIDFTKDVEVNGHRKAPFGSAFLGREQQAFAKVIPERTNFRVDLEQSLDRLAK